MMRCAHCHTTRRQVGLWGQIIATGDNVCCWLAHIAPPKPRRGATAKETR